MNLNLIAVHYHDVSIIHASYSFCSIFFCANLQSALGFVLFFFSFFLYFAMCFWSLF